MAVEFGFYSGFYWSKWRWRRYWQQAL